MPVSTHTSRICRVSERFAEPLNAESILDSLDTHGVDQLAVYSGILRIHCVHRGLMSLGGPKLTGGQ